VEFFWWLVAIVLMAIGLIGTVVPVLPGAVIILAAAVIHQVMLGSEKSLGWWNVGALTILALLSYGIELATGYFGAKRFGATRWGILGAAVGAIAGLFFPFPGLIVGPVIGAIVGEFLGGKRLVSWARGLGDTLGHPGWDDRQTGFRPDHGQLVLPNGSLALLVRRKSRNSCVLNGQLLALST
jgi:uncharacterized protein